MNEPFHSRLAISEVPSTPDAPSVSVMSELDTTIGPVSVMYCGPPPTAICTNMPKLPAGRWNGGENDSTSRSFAPATPVVEAVAICRHAATLRLLPTQVPGVTNRLTVTAAPLAAVVRVSILQTVMPHGLVTLTSKKLPPPAAIDVVPLRTVSRKLDGKIARDVENGPRHSRLTVNVTLNGPLQPGP